MHGDGVPHIVAAKQAHHLAGFEAVVLDEDVGEGDRMVSDLEEG